MIQIIKTFKDCKDFVNSFYGDSCFSDPMLSSEEQLHTNLLNAIESPDGFFVFGVFRHEQMTGLFSFLISPEEKYMEMVVGLSRELDAYEEMLQYLEQNYSFYDVDFVFNPGNHLLSTLLESKQAEFEPEQQKMVLHRPGFDLNTTGIELLSEKYVEQYCLIHSKDMYWTGEKVAAAQNIFRTFLAVHEEKVVGYIDVTFTHKENEPYDLFVLKEYRGKGYGRKLLAKALEMNQPNGMMLMVDVENTPAIKLYESMGFVKVMGQNTIVARWNVPALASES